MVDIQAFVSTPETVAKKRLTLKASETTQQSLLKLKKRIQQRRRKQSGAPTVDLDAAIEQSILEVIQSTNTFYDQAEQRQSPRRSLTPTSVSHPVASSGVTS